MRERVVILGAYTLPAFIVFFGHEAFESYLDAGSGSIILQAVLGVLIGAAFAVKIFWHRIKGFFGGLFSKSEGRDESSSGDT